MWKWIILGFFLLKRSPAPAASAAAAAAAAPAQNFTGLPARVPITGGFKATPIVGGGTFRFRTPSANLPMGAGRAGVIAGARKLMEPNVASDSQRFSEFMEF